MCWQTSIGSILEVCIAGARWRGARDTAIWGRGMAENSTQRVSRLLLAPLLASLLRLSRPGQWIKNSVVLAGIVFAEATDQPRAVLEAALALIVFTLASSAVYVFNDRIDAESDRNHPLKYMRPIATGEVSPQVADRFAAILVMASVGLGLLIGQAFVAVVVAYIVMMIAYTLWLKHIAILDVTAIALGFVLRAIGGAAAVDVPISGWLLACAFLLALFLGFSKRRAELQALGASASNIRAALEGYTGQALDQLVGITAMSALVTYTLYTIDSSSVPESHAMVATVPLVAFAIFRYLFLVYGRDLGQSPDVLLFRDKWLLGSVLGWGVLALVLMEFGG